MQQQQWRKVYENPPTDREADLKLQTHPKKLLLVLAVATGLSGCGSWWLPRPHKIGIQQGNLLDESAVVQIEQGMSKAEVQNRLGNPLLQQSFHPDRWDYVYSLNRSGETPVGQRLTIYFSEGRITKIERNEIGNNL